MSAYNGEKYIEEQIQSLINNKKDDMQLSLLICWKNQILE